MMDTAYTVPSHLSHGGARISIFRLLLFIVLATVPTAFLLFHIYHIDHTYSIITMWSPETTIHLVPELTLGLDFIGLIISIASAAGLVGIVRRSKSLITFYFSFLLTFISAQLALSIRTLLHPDSWISHLLAHAWDRADPEFIQTVEAEFDCKGYSPLATTYSSSKQACEPILRQQFGDKLLVLCWLTFVLRIVQLIGVLIVAWLVSIREIEVGKMDEEAIPWILCHEEVQEKEEREREKGSVALVREGDVYKEVGKI